MKYSLDQMHRPKKMGDRRNGKTVDAIVSAIGSIMVLDNERVPFVIHYMQDTTHIRAVFEELCREYFDVKPIYHRQFEWGIEGYKSRLFFVTLDEWERGRYQYSEVNAISDLHWTRIK